MDRELLLIKFFGLGHLDRCINRIDILEIIGRRCFIEDHRGMEVDSVRRCLQAIHNCSPFRETEEYDKLIEFSEDYLRVLNDFGGS